MISQEGAACGSEPIEDAEDECERLPDFGGLDGRNPLQAARGGRGLHREQDAFAPVFLMVPPEVCRLL